MGLQLDAGVKGDRSPLIEKRVKCDCVNSEFQKHLHKLALRFENCPSNE